MGTKVVGESNSIEYSTPLKIVEPLIKEFGLVKDVCASSLNYKLPDYWTKEDNALAQFWQCNVSSSLFFWSAYKTNKND